MTPCGPPNTTEKILFEHFGFWLSTKTSNKNYIRSQESPRVVLAPSPQEQLCMAGIHKNNFRRGLKTVWHFDGGQFVVISYTKSISMNTIAIMTSNTITVMF